MKLCDICSAHSIETPAIFRSVIKIHNWMGNAGAATAYVCLECYDNLDNTSMDQTILAQEDCESIF